MIPMTIYNRNLTELNITDLECDYNAHRWLSVVSQILYFAVLLWYIVIIIEIVCYLFYCHLLCVPFLE